LGRLTLRGLAIGRSTGAIAVLARLGYLSRGAVYLSVGGIAGLKAAGLTPHAKGSLDALRAWAQWPLGVVLLWVIGLGLCAFAAWRALQAVLDIERSGRGPKALLGRVGKAVSGVLYGTLGYEVLRFLDTLRDLRHAGDDEFAAPFGGLMASPFSRTLLMGVGAAVLLAGLGNMVRAGVDRFTPSLDCRPDWRAPLEWTARAGYFARGLAFLPAGWLTLRAGWRARPNEALDIGRGLETVLATPFGRGGLAAIAAGLIAFGLFGVAKAALRRVDQGRAAAGGHGDGPATPY
jgi:hypothetical protein